MLIPRLHTATLIDFVSLHLESGRDFLLTFLDHFLWLAHLRPHASGDIIDNLNTEQLNLQPQCIDVGVHCTFNRVIDRTYGKRQHGYQVAREGKFPLCRNDEFREYSVHLCDGAEACREQFLRLLASGVDCRIAEIGEIGNSIVKEYVEPPYTACPHETRQLQVLMTFT
jgi:hypothetical protein